MAHACAPYRQYLNLLADALPAFPQRTREKGEGYYIRGAVGTVYFKLDKDEKLAAVFSTVKGTTEYETGWFFQSDTAAPHWTNKCDCPVSTNCKHAYAMALSVLVRTEAEERYPDSVLPHDEERKILEAISEGKFKQLSDPEEGGRLQAGEQHPGVPAGANPAQTPFEALAALVSEHHKRPLARHEVAVLKTITEFWSNHETSIPGTVLNALGITDSKGQRFSFHADSIRLERNAAITSPLKYWQFLACLAHAQHYHLPDFLMPFTAHDEVGSEIAKVARAKKIQQWKKTFEDEHKQSFAATASTRAATFPAEVRIRFSPTKPVWEVRVTPGAPWTPARSGQPKQWFSDFLNDRLALPPTSSLYTLFAKITAIHLGEHSYAGTSDIHILRPQDQHTRHLFLWLLLTPRVGHLLAAENGEPFQLPPIPLTWQALPGKTGSTDVIFQLVRPDGASVSLDEFEIIKNDQAILAIHNATVYACPAPLPVPNIGYRSDNPYTKAPAIPIEALRTPGAIRYIRRSKIDATALDLPAVSIIPLRPTFTIRSEANESGTEFAHIQLFAHATDNSITRVNRDDKWQTLRTAEPAPDAPITEYDTSHALVAGKHLASLGTEWNFANDAYAYRLTRQKLEDFAAWLLEARALGIDLQVAPALAALARDPDTATLEVEFTAPADGEGSGIDWFDLQIALKPADTDLTREELQLLLRANGKFVRIPGKGWRRLQVTFDAASRETLKTLGIEPDALNATPERHRFHTLQLADERIAGILPEEHARRIRERAAALRAISPPIVSSALNATLRPYQVEGFHFLAHLAENNLGGVLADDMGLGKTVQALTWLLWLQERKNGSQIENSAVTVSEQKNEFQISNFQSQIKDSPASSALRVLVVCPKSVVPNWQIETARFAPTLTTATLDLDASDPGSIVPVHAAIVVVNYAQLRNNAAPLAARHWDVVILDEGQNIKNPTSQTAKAARDLPARHRLVLTGTPIENRTLDLWSLFAFAMPGLLGTQAIFKRLYNEKTAPLARARLAARARHFMLRRTKAQVATDLPLRIEEDLYVELDGSQRKLYDVEVKRARLALLNIKTEHEFGLARFNILQSLLRLRQICCHPALIGFSETSRRASSKTEAEDATPVMQAPSAKLDALLEQLESIVETGNRVLVFSQFVTMLELIREELKRRAIRHLILTGKTENRQALVDEFQSPEGPPVFLLSLKAAGSGLNLTAASYVFLFDPWWNPAVEAQAIDRTHRIGQKNQVIACRLLARNTVEEKIRQLQQQKAELARDIVQEENLATVLDLQALRFVLS
jgi:superfamily II DNA or RNA helicase